MTRYTVTRWHHGQATRLGETDCTVPKWALYRLAAECAGWPYEDTLDGTGIPRSPWLTWGEVVARSVSELGEEEV